MAVVSGGGPVEDTVADSDGLGGCDGVLVDEQAPRTAVNAITTTQHNCRFRMAGIVAWAGYYLRVMTADAAPPARRRWRQAGR